MAGSRKVIAPVIAVTVSLVLAWGLGEIDCAFRECVEDDASNRAIALVGPYVALAYMMTTLAAFLLAARVLAKRRGLIFAALVPSAMLSVFFAGVFYRPDLDSLTGIAGLFLWLFVPWFFANLGGLYVRGRIN